MPPIASILCPLVCTTPVVYWYKRSSHSGRMSACRCLTAKTVWMYSCEKTSAMILDVFDVVMFTNIGGNGWVKKIRMLGVQTLGPTTNVRPLPRPFVVLVRFATNVGCYKRWVLQTLGLSEAIHGFGSFCYKRWVLQTLGLSEARYFMGINVFIYKRWASPRPGISWG